MSSPRPLRPTAPFLLDGFSQMRPVMPAWTPVPSLNDPPPPYESPEPHGIFGSQRNPNFLRPSPRISQPNPRISRTSPRFIDVLPINQSERDQFPRRRTQEIKANRRYLATKFAALKLLEFLTCSTAFSACFVFRNDYGLGFLSGDRSGFFIMLLVISWILVIILFWMSLIGYLGGTANPSHFLKIVIIHISLGFLILISSALLTDATLTGVCNSQTVNACIAFKAAVGCGFFSTILFWIDAGLHYCAFKQSVVFI